MKNRGKKTEQDQNITFDETLSCEKHPYSSSIGICAYCLRERLLKLVCSDCGEQRLSSCACSEISFSSSSFTNNSSIDIGSVGRVSFLIENEKTTKTEQLFFPNSKVDFQHILFKKSSSSRSHVGIKRNSNGFWKIANFFQKKRGKSDFDEKSDDFWVCENMGVSRSRSLCSLMGVDCMSVNGSLAYDSANKNLFSESKARKSGVESENGLKSPVKMVDKLSETDFKKSIDDSSFIELQPDSYGFRSPSRSMIGDDEVYGNGSSCRITVKERGIKKSRKSLKVWKWIFRNHHYHHHHDSRCGIWKEGR